MADPKDKTTGGAGAAPPKTATSSNPSKARSAAGHAASQIFLKIRKPAARWAAKNMPEPLKDKAKTWASWLPYISTLVATLTPDLGIWKQVDDFQQDFMDALETELKHPSADGAAAATKPVPGREPDPTAIYVKIGLVANTLDQRVRDAFFYWYGKLSPERREKFHRLVEKATDAQLADYLKLSAAELNARVDAMPEPPKPPEKPPSFAQIRMAVYADATLNPLLTALLGRLTPERQARFWEAAESKIKSMEDFKALLKLTDDQIVATLDLDRKSAAQQLTAAVDGLEAAVAASSIPQATADFRTKMAAYKARARARW